MKLSDTELEAGLAAVQYHGYSDFFPKPAAADFKYDSRLHGSALRVHVPTG
jgi:hypothetical protein